MVSDTQRLIDGALEFSRGVDTTRSPSRIERNMLAGLVNAACRNDAIGQRPGWRQSLLQFNGDAQAVFNSGWYQRGSGYHPRGTGNPRLVLSISGRLWTVDVKTWAVDEIKIAGEIKTDGTPNTQNDPHQPRVWFCQFEEYLGWQDNQDTPIIYNGANGSRSDVLGSKGQIDGRPKKQIPVGNAMAYCNGRLIVALPDKRSFTIGDIVGGPSGAGSAGRRLAPSYFTENQFLNEVEGFTVPVGQGPITGITDIAQIDTSLGQGPALVVTTDAGFTLNLPTDRTTWLNVTYPIQTKSLIGDGFQSQESLVLVNGDVWGRAEKFIRSYFQARRDFQVGWVNGGQSFEVAKYIDPDVPDLIEWASGVLFDNRLLESCSPQLVPGRGIVHRGLVALDFLPTTSVSRRDPPAWDGMWTGLQILQLISLYIGTVKHVYAVTLDGAQFGVWELIPDAHYDLQNDGVRRRVTRAIEFPRWDFGNRLDRKRFTGVEFWVDEVWGQVDYTAYHRPDQDKCWHPYQSFQHCAQGEACPPDAVNGCLVTLNRQMQFRPRAGLQIPPYDEVQPNNFPADLGYEHQVRLEITGDCNIQSVRATADKHVSEIWPAQAPSTETCSATNAVTYCPPNDLALPFPTP